MASPLCTVNTLSTVDGVDVTAASTVSIELIDAAGVNSWEIECISTDDSNLKATINGTLTVDNITKTAEFTAPALGSAMIWRSRVNSGRDSNGRLDPSLTTTFGIYVLSAQGNRVIAVNETTEGSASFGWVVPINLILRNTILDITATAGAGLVYSAGEYFIQSTDSSINILADEIRLNPISAVNHANQTDPALHALATGAANGFLSSPHYSLLAGATPLATPEALVLRDISGYAAFARVYTPSLRTEDGTTSTALAISTGSASAGASGISSLASGGATGGNAGAVQIAAGTSTTNRGGDVLITSGGSGGSSQGGDVAINFVAGASGKYGSLAIGANTADDGGGEKVISIGNAAVLPTTNPSAGVIVYVESGALKARGTSGTVTTLAPAEPHCPKCGLDFALEWANPESGKKLSICAPCFVDALHDAGINTDFAFKDAR